MGLGHFAKVDIVQNVSTLAKCPDPISPVPNQNSSDYDRSRRDLSESDEFSLGGGGMGPGYQAKVTPCQVGFDKVP